MHKRGLYEDRSLPLTKSIEKNTIQAFWNEIRPISAKAPYKKTSFITVKIIAQTRFATINKTRKHHAKAKLVTQNKR
jgi:hypothetical protein